MDPSSIDGSFVNTFPTRGSLPDFELSELWLRPRISTVDLGEVKSVRLKVDVHGVHTQQTHRSTLFRDHKNGENVCISLLSQLLFPLSVLNFRSLTLSLRVGVQRQHPKSPSAQMVAGLQSATARKASPSSSSLPCTEHSITSAARHRTGTLTYFPTSSHRTLSSCEHKNKDDSSKRCCLVKTQEKQK